MTAGAGTPAVLTDTEIRANHFDLVSRWADDLAHEIKNPLSAMVINLELVKRRAALGDGDEAVRRVEVVESELHRVHDLVDSLLKTIRPWPGQQHANISSVIESLEPMIRARAAIRQVEWSRSGGNAAIHMAPGRFAQAFLNLVDNAVDAAGAGGSVEARIELDGDTVHVLVTDSGPGPDPALADRLTTIGVTSNPDRAGLGLAVVEHLCRAAGGDLRVATDPDEPGTVAMLLLPRAGSA